jgi:hypothetical protein
MATDQPTLRPRRRPARRWYARHWPAFSAVLDDDFATLSDRLGRYRALDEARDERLVCCVDCRAPMIHGGYGHYYCPYERARRHELARRALRLGMEDR